MVLLEYGNLKYALSHLWRWLMAKKTPELEKKPSKEHFEWKGLLALGFSLFLVLSLVSFDSQEPHKNWLGLVGWGLSFGFTFLFGLCSYFFVLFFGWLGWRYLVDKEPISLSAKIAYFSIFTSSCAILLSLYAERDLFFPSFLDHWVYSESHFFDFPYPHQATRHYLGGMPFYFLYCDLPVLNLQHLLSDVGTCLTFSITAFASFLLLTKMRLNRLPSLLKKWTASLKEKWTASREKEEESEALHSPQEIEESLAKRISPLYAPPPRLEKPSEPRIEPRIRLSPERPVQERGVKEELSRKQVAINAQRVVNGDFTTYRLPPLSLLNQPKKVDQPSLKKELKKQASNLEETLLSFGIEAKVGEIHCGPTITSFEVHPAIGVKVQKIKTLENDIALNLQAKSIRIIAPIPGKAAVGVEIPSLYPQEVSFRELLANYHQGSRKMTIPLLLGKGVSGDQVVSDLSKMPHCLIAGATGSGKSVCINTIILSILMNARPDEIKLVMIDPKKVELTPYTNLPHMIAPVITEAHGAYAALNWLVKEMQTRYDVLKQLGVRNISAFNNRQINKELEASLNIPIPARMHGIVAIIDEFADLMMASSSDLETPIARIAQMARAVGIHLILATQRPSREVITGLIKANFPTRLAFKVSSRINSQIILDDVGAESLLGNGDMLFLPPGTSSLLRAQGAYISDEEINRVVQFICEQAPPNYLIESFDKMRFEEGGGGREEDSPKDSLYEQAKTLVVETRVASTTYLQRKLKIGYARAASLMDELEMKGIISTQEGAKPRRILLDGKSPANPNQVPYEEQELFE